jgi:hypothetical protein
MCVFEKGVSVCVCVFLRKVLVCVCVCVCKARKVFLLRKVCVFEEGEGVSEKCVCLRGRLLCVECEKGVRGCVCDKKLFLRVWRVCV